MKRTFEDLKEYMNVPMRDIEDWNDRRDAAKKFFSQELISELDSSGFVKEVVKTKRHRRYERS